MARAAARSVCHTGSRGVRIGATVRGWTVWTCLIASLCISPPLAQAQDDEEEPEFGATARIAPPPPLGSTELEIEETNRVPGAAGDPLRVIESLPGTLTLRSGLPYVYVRGAPPSGTRYIYDSIPIPILSHLAVGASVIHPAAISAVRFFSGSAPARYGRMTGGVVELTPTPYADSATGEAQLRLIDVGGYANVPIGADAQMIVGARYGYPGPIASVFTPGFTIHYGDYLARAKVPLGDRDYFEVVSLGSVDVLHNPPWVASTSQRGDLDLMFHRVELRLVRDLGPTEMGVALLTSHDRSVLGTDLSVEALTLKPRLWAEHRPSSRLRFRLGADFAGSVGGIDDPDGGVSGPFGMIAVDLPIYADVPTRSAGGGFGELDFRLADVSFALGVRGDVHIVGGDAQTSLDPRGRISWRANEHMCVIVCSNDRMFLGDSPCDRTDRGDFDHYVPFNREGDQYVLEWKKVPSLTLAIDDPTHARLTVAEIEDLPLDRVGEVPPLCADESRTAMPYDQE